MKRIAISLFAFLLTGAALSPEAQWKKDVEGQNMAYSKTPHAMLKISDSAYIGDGQSAVLMGKPGNPASWHWAKEAGAKGPLVVTLKGGKISAVLNGKPVTEALEKSIVIEKDVDVVGHPTQVGAGVNGWRIFIFNQQAAAAKSFTGVSYFPYDPAWRITAAFTPDAKLPARDFRTSRGTDKRFYHAGDAQLVLNGKRVTLPFYAGSNDPAKVDEMSAFFTDAQTGKGTYGAGRYVDVIGFGKFPPATVTIDFNEAYNPNCARSPHFTCPVAVDDLPLAVKAGERDPHAAH